MTNKCSFPGLSNFCETYPPNLDTICCSEDFDRPLTENCFSNTITYLQFGKMFNSPINWLPPNLQCIGFGEYFNQPINVKLPKTLLELVWRWRWCGNTNSLQVFDSSSHFNHPLNNLPTNLKSLTLSPSFTHKISRWPSLGMLHQQNAVKTEEVFALATNSVILQ